jgi:O-antigen/teichoic acid export membrane protein
MKYSARLHRRRCIGLRLAVVFAILLIALSWGDWAIIAVAGAGVLLALGAYWRDCRRPAGEATQSDTDARAS